MIEVYYFQFTDDLCNKIKEIIDKKNAGEILNFNIYSYPISTRRYSSILIDSSGGHVQDEYAINFKLKIIRKSDEVK